MAEACSSTMTSRERARHRGLVSRRLGRYDGRGHWDWDCGVGGRFGLVVGRVVLVSRIVVGMWSVR